MPIRPALLATAAGEFSLAEVGVPVPLDRLVPGSDGEGGPWEVEIGFGKGRYLLRRCREDRDRRFLGIEIAGEYLREWVRKARRLRLSNFLMLRGEALSLLATALPAGFAEVVHVYFPDPWPKSRHQKRRLFEPESIDLVLNLLAPGGRLSFATDFLEYGELVAEILTSMPGLAVRRLDAWPEGPRTHYEEKFVALGQPIVRLEAWFTAGARAGLHPRGLAGLLVAARRPEAAGAL